MSITTGTDTGRAAGTPAEVERAEARTAHNYHPLPVVLSHAEGAWMTDIEGNRFLDLLAGYSALNFGHSHPRLVATAHEQLDKLTLTSRAFVHDAFADFCAALGDLCGKELVLPMNTGAEAVETAIKVSRKWGYETKGVTAGAARIIVAAGNFHGRTTTIVGFSDDQDARGGFGPFAPGFDMVPYGDLTAIEAAITDETVAVLVEPIQGEAGVIIPPAGYLKRARELCDRHNVILILDEIQTGLGRTGKLLAEEHEGIEADLTLVGKALSGGFYPVSAVLSNDEVMSAIKPGEHGSTFGGNPLACAVARAALKVLVEEDMVGNSERIGARLKASLESIQSDRIKEVRGRGLMLALELHEDLGGARPYCEALQHRGILCKDTHDHTIRISPPLVLTEAQADWIAEQFEAVLRA